MINPLSVIAILTGVASSKYVSFESENFFMGHIARHGLSFGTREEYQFRLNLYMETDKKIKEINFSNNTFTVGHNKFSTWTE